MLLGAALVIVGSATLYFAVTGNDPRSLLTGKPSGPSPFDLSPFIGIVSAESAGKLAGAASTVITGTPKSGTAPIRLIIIAARVIPGWRLGRICGADSLEGPSVSEHFHCNAADLMCGLTVGATLSQFLINAGRARALPIHCVIWNRNSYSRENNFRKTPYSGGSAHTDHVHVSGWPSIGGSC